MSFARLTAVASIISLTTAVHAQDIPLAPLSNFGKVAVPATQSGGGYVAFEQAFGGTFDAEPASRYPESSVMRQLGRAVGRLDVAFDRGLGYCTAFLISDQHLMTNAHCLDGGQVQAISFVAGYVDTGVEEGTKTYTVGTTPVEISPRGDLDFAILQVFGNPASEWGTVTLSAMEFDARRDAGMPLMILGHPVFQVAPVPIPQALYVSRKECGATQINPRTGNKLRHTCDTLVGNSGSPVFSDDSREVIALHHAGDPREGINLAIPMRLIAQQSQVVAKLVASAPPAAVTPGPSELDAAFAYADATALDDLAARVDALESVVRDYPGTQAAGRAAKQLSQDRPKVEPPVAPKEEPVAIAEPEPEFIPEPGSGYMGVRVQDVSEDVAEELGLGAPVGALVTDVNDDGAADFAGILAGDIILSMDGVTIADTRMLVRTVSERGAGQTFPLTVFRDGKEQNLDITLIGRPEPKPEVDPGAAPAVGDFLSMTLSEIGPQQREDHGLSDQIEGLVVIAVEQDSEAWDKSLRVGDVITEAGQSGVTTLVEMSAQLDEARSDSRKSVLLLVQRNGDPRFVALEL